LPPARSNMVTHDWISHCAALRFFDDRLARYLPPRRRKSRGPKHARAVLSEGSCPARRRRRPSRRHRRPLSKATPDVAPASRHSQASWAGSRIVPRFRTGPSRPQHRGHELTEPRAASTRPRCAHQRTGTLRTEPTRGRQTMRMAAPTGGRTDLLRAPSPVASPPTDPPRMRPPAKGVRCLPQRTPQAKPQLRLLLRRRVPRRLQSI
jgi:hypothetical protein